MKKTLAFALALALCVLAIGCAPAAPAPAATAAPAASAAPAAPAASTAPAAPAAPATEKTVVKIGVLAPLSGAVASQGKLMKMGATACLEYFNKSVGFKNQNIEVELVFGDSESTPDVGQVQFEKLINVDNCIAVIGSYQSGVTSPCATLANKYHVPYVIVNAISDGILATDANYVFRPCLGTFSQEASQQAWLEALSKITPIQNVAFVGSADDYGKGNRVSFGRITDALGMKIAVEDSVQAGVADMSGTVQKIKNGNIDVVLASLQLNEALLFQKQMKEYKCNVPIMALGGGYMDSTFLASAGDTAEYVVSSSAWVPDVLSMLSPEAGEYYTRMKEIGDGQSPTETSCNTWLALGIVLDALDKAASVDREALAAAIDKTDMGPDDWANMYNKHQYIKFEDGKLPDGAMMYNQNYGAGLQFGQIIDGEWHLVGPFTLAGEMGGGKNVFVWPQPAWENR